MRYIEPHGHMVSRTTDDYQAMAMAGCQAVSEPAFWAGFDRSSVQGFYDYFCQLTQHEPRRAAMFGLPHYTWLCINPKESEDLKLADEVLGIIPEFMESPNVLGIGEIGLNKNSRNEVKVHQSPIDLMIREMKDCYSLIIFPEGRRNPAEEMIKFKKDQAGTKLESVDSSQETIIFGLPTCDLDGILYTDIFFGGREYSDEF